MTHFSSTRWTNIFWAGVLSISLFSAAVMMAADDGIDGWQAPAHAARRANPIASDSRSISAGKAVYNAQCADCHGAKGKGDGPTAKDLNPRPKDLSDARLASDSDGALFWKITTGRNGMPAIDDVVSQNDRWNVVNFIRTFSPAAATQPAK
jgi:mono/diheme cytochrome c family protein